MLTEMTKRKYTLKQRARQQEETRQRIVRATMALHEEIGPRETSVSAIAQRAGVQRLTVYRHFPDEGSLFQACTATWFDENPPPDPDNCRDDDPAVFTRRTLAALYGYYRANARMWRGAYRDVEDVEALQAPMAEFTRFLDLTRDRLTGAWAPPETNEAAVRATIGHALRFSTWVSLDEQRLNDGAAADLVTRWLEALRAADASSPRTATGNT
jgi:AcrR family transcriptional regulator